MSAADELIARISAAWQKIMKLPSVATDANFFELGGDSLLAVSLLLEIERMTGHKLAITTIYDAPTIADQAALVAGGIPVSQSLLVPLKEGAGETPIFIVHGIGGTVIELAKLAGAVRTDNRVYAIQARGLDGSSPPVDSIKEMAAHYVEAMRAVQPAGPYLLAGYSFGGMVALEMARIAMQTMHADAAVLMIDTYPHPRTWPRRSQIELRLRRNLNRLKLASAHPARTVRKLIAHRRAGANETALPTRRLWPYEPDPNLPLALRQVHEAAGLALVDYVPEFLSSRVTFLAARNAGVTYPSSPRAIWQSRVTTFELHRVAGDHVSMVREHYDAVGAHVAQWARSACKHFAHGKARLAPSPSPARARLPLAAART